MTRGKQIFWGFLISFFGLMFSAIAGEILNLHWLKKGLMIIIVFPWFLLVGRNLFFYLIETQIAFQQKDNTKNIDKAPVNWIIKNEMKLKRIIAGIWFFGAIFTVLGILINE